MANWCNTEIVIDVRDSEQAAYLAMQIEKWVSNGERYDDEGYLMENIVVNAGLGEVSDFKVLGIVLSVTSEGGTVSVISDSKWEPEVEMWRVLVEKYCPEGKLLYYASVPGDGLFETNDPSFADKYVVEIDGASDWLTAEEAVSQLGNKFGEDSEVFNGFVEDCVDEDGSIDCDAAQEYFYDALEDSDDFDEVLIGKWSVVSES